ncbi:MAG: Gfo/Idh/MocA family oxidoreductase [Lachnospiraceae bacterium]|nr:Gfo/Idh/MocA family oxidoreductase [Lachnospiraceae bacterium]
MKIGVLCPAEIAARRFMPALSKVKEFEFAGIAVNSLDERFGSSADENNKNQIQVIENGYKKAEALTKQYGGKIYGSYEDMVKSKDIEAIYIPLPPSLHYYWAKQALINGKHVLVEKPSTISLRQSLELINIAKDSNVAIHENYMFVFHKQLEEIIEIIKSGDIGDIRLIQIMFGFPHRDSNDFRYNKDLGGGALIDAGGYTLKLAKILLGENVEVENAQLNYDLNYDVDIYGSGIVSNSKGEVAQISFGMDNCYRCDLNVWGSKGSLLTKRILTAPDKFVPTVTIKKGNDEAVMELSSDDAFEKSIRYFEKCINDSAIRNESFLNIVNQAELLSQFMDIATIYKK